MNSQQNVDQEIGNGSEEQAKCDFVTKSNKPLYIDIILELPESEDKELIKNVRVAKNSQGDILLSSVCSRLHEIGFDVTGMIVSYYSSIEQMYIFAGKDPIPFEKDGISVSNLCSNRLALKFRSGDDTYSKKSLPVSSLNNESSSLCYSLENKLKLSEGGMGATDGSSPITTPCLNEISSTQITPPIPRASLDPSMGGPDSNTANASSRRCIRTKERNISFVIEKVSMWRKLYNGIQNPSGNITRYSLDDSAKKVGISKKSLDDYLLQLRYGKKFGFDFNENKEEKIGKLRAFVKKKKREEKEKKEAYRNGLR
ncbi:unnamed protein product [Moneuplotes crassus]|uniref:Uncharacterized protein n=1 Tax=Euplotes crassus TaxID=5936 RepID=A0AAD1UIY4_EUPCR|nr:unnamed protein product [Moneuplotes crassus]